MLRHLTRLAAAVIVGGTLVAGYVAFRIWEVGARDDVRRVDVVVVLGAAQYDGRPSPVFRARLSHAVRLYHDGVAPILVVTGGKLPGDRTTEAAAARAYALDHNVPDSAIVVEDQGRTTLESLRAVGSLLRDRGLGTAVFVSDRTHMLRVLRMAGDQGIDAYGSPTTTSPNEASLAERVKDTIHEMGGLGHYFLTGS